MERYLNPEDAGGSAVLAADWVPGLARDFRQALLATDFARARRVVGQALAQGGAPGRLYVEMVRPAFSALPFDDGAIQSRVTAVACRAIMADLAAALPMTESIGPGRAALLSSRQDGIERIDGDLAIDFLEVDGWAVQRLHGPRAALSLGPAARPDSIELAVAVVAGPEDALRLAPACTALRRLPDPPVVLLCDFSGRSDWPTASVALGADAFVSDPQELVVQATRRLPAAGVRRWGVQIARRRDSLVLAPTGRLDGESAQRLVEVAQSRVGTFSRLVIDLRDLAEFSDGGVQDLCTWSDRGALQDVDLLFVGDPAVRARIDALGMAQAVPLADAACI